jgi:protein-tyrosine-phosphatase
VDSAGFLGPDRRSPQHAVDVARDRAVDLSGHRSKLLNQALINSAALVVVMDPWQRREVLWIAKRRDLPVILLSDLRPSAGDRRAILDPVAGGRELYEQSYDEVDASIGRLVQILTKQQS